MKTLALLFLLAAPIAAHALDIRPGDSLADVQSVLGPPRGQAQAANKLILDYGCVQIQLVDGKVVNPALSGSDGDTAPPVQPTTETQAAEQHAQHAAAGEAIKAQTVADPAFADLSPGNQLLFWQNFRVNYPEVSCDAEYAQALAGWQTEQLQIAAQGRMPVSYSTLHQSYYPQSARWTR